MTSSIGLKSAQICRRDSTEAAKSPGMSWSATSMSMQEWKTFKVSPHTPLLEMLDPLKQQQTMEKGTTNSTAKNMHKVKIDSPSPEALDEARFPSSSARAHLDSRTSRSSSAQHHL
eukprot:CAMPEP_0181497818 /NCGR_PEP_ID=MMETSP1110-20121109/53748_1 /TAXON_ID=174948 /ORGANISM="Symbiodinium sp., Strain CCMP421" /LENGTH=115 /DNA_ID=CAMNT_0023625803 /DNA_START=131 /DNA_END=479 /DNA_ORIENTATION=+